MTTSDTLFEEIIDEGVKIINDSLEKEIKPIMISINNYLKEKDIPISSIYDEKSYYTIEGYPKKNFIRTCNEVKRDIQDLLYEEFNIDEDEVTAKPVVDNLIFGIYYKQYTFINLTNIFYPHQNHLYSIDTWKGKSRFNDDTSIFIHPKFEAEKLLRDLYDPLLFDEYKNNQCKFDRLMKTWKDLKLNDFIRIIKPKQVKLKVDVPSITQIHIDHNVVGLIRDDVKEDIIDVFKKEYGVNSISENEPKTITDVRLRNMILKKDDFVIAKLWIIKDYELIPLLPHDKTQVHILAIMRITLADYINYSTIESSIAEIKFAIFMYFYNKYSVMKYRNKLISLDECYFIGDLYKYSSYLKELKHKGVIEKIKKYMK